MKNNDIDIAAIDTKEKILETVASLRNKLQDLRLRISFGPIEDSSEIRKTRKNIARLLTKLNSLK